MITHAFRAAVVAVDERSVRFPGIRGLVLEFLAIRVMCLDAVLDFGVDSFLNSW